MKNLIDKYDRELSYLRISITDRCNLRCRYCVPLTPMTMLTHDDILRFEEILRIVKVGAKHGIKKVRVTGGEPLVRKGVYRFLEDLNNIVELKDISLTTNGVLLKDNIDKIQGAGIKRINISLDSIDRGNYESITGRDHFQKVWEGILAAMEKGFSPVKLNVVGLKGLNDHELLDFAKLSIDYPLHVRFIEYMPMNKANVRNEQQILTPDIKSKVSELGGLHPVQNEDADGPAFRFRFENAKGEIGFISPISNHFCSQCNRLRLTANGMLRSCLLSNHQIDLKETIRNGGSDEDISEVFLEAIRKKQKKHALGSSTDYKIKTPMTAIGG